MTAESLKPQVFEREQAPSASAPAPGTPLVFSSERTDRIVAVQPRPKALPVPAPPKSRVRSFAFAALGVGITGWFIVDAYWWIAAAFERSTMLGTIAATAVVAAVAGAGTIIAREVTSLWRLRNVESIRERFDRDIVTPHEARQTIADILAVIPRERETQAAIEVFQRQVQPHHNVAQQVEILSNTVMKPLDARAEEHVRAAVVRAFGITAISPTALSDALFFLAVGVRMVRRIAATYGHRPTTAATIHSVAPAGGRGRQARRHRHRLDLDRAAAWRRDGGTPRHHRGRRLLRVLPHGTARRDRDGHVPADPVPGRRSAQDHADGDERDPATIRAGSTGLTRAGVAGPHG